MSSLRERANSTHQWVQYAGLDPVSKKQKYEHVTMLATTAKGREAEQRRLDRKWVEKKRTVGTTAATT
jgi:hypothetical protein